MAVVLGVDSSTQSTKIEARDLETGAVVATGRATHPPTTPPVSEQDPEAWWSALVEACAALGPVRADVVAISVGGQQHGLVVLGADDRPLRAAKLWNDTTSAPNAEALVEALGRTRWATGCGSVPLAAFTVSKVAWLAEHEPRVLAATRRIMLPHDYLTWRLTGEHVTDRGDASGTGWFDPAGDHYDPELLAAAIGATPLDREALDLLPRVLQPGESAGPVRDDVAAELGLPSGVVVGPGTGDNMAAALGLGLGPGDVALSLGTSGTVYAVAETPTADETGLVAGFADAGGRYLPLVCTLNATKVTDTVARWLATDAVGLAALALAAPAGTGGEGPVLVPYFDGERTPNLPAATGLFAGLRTTTGPEELARAAHDGVLCGLLDGVEALEAAGVATGGRLVLIGGGARSAAYRRRAADLRGSPVLVPDEDETVATGAAVQAAAVHTARPASAVARDWDLGRGATVEPSAGDGPAVRAAYARAAAEVAAHHGSGAT